MFASPFGLYLRNLPPAPSRSRRTNTLVPAMRGAEVQDDLPAAADDLGGDVHKGPAEALASA